MPVLTKETTEKTIDVPVPFSQIPPPFPGAQGFGGPPQFRKQTVQNTEVVTIQRIGTGAHSRCDRGRSRLE